MISLRQTLSDWDRIESLQKVAMDCYGAAIEATARNVVDFERELARLHREQLDELARQVRRAVAADDLKETRIALEGELQDYSGKAGRYLLALQEKLNATTQSLGAVIETIRTADPANRDLETGLQRLAALVHCPEVSRACPELQVLVAGVEDNLRRLLEQNRLAVAQLRAEVDTLRGALSAARQAARRDPISGVLNRAKTLSTLREWINGRRTFSLLFFEIGNLDYARRRYGSRTLDDIVAVFSRRLTSALEAQSAVAGRWGDDSFVVLLERSKPEALWLSENLSPRLAGPYVFRDEGFTRDLTLQIKTGVLEAKAPASEKQVLRDADRLLAALQTLG
jgi:GGDEF domain-containing protein